jgi:hypothetical protein
MCFGQWTTFGTFVEDNDALIFYKKIAEWLKNGSENSQLYFEINQYLGKEMINLWKMNFKTSDCQGYLREWPHD